MQFINIVVHSVEDMNFRVHLQYEFTQLGLDDYLEKLRHHESEELQVKKCSYFSSNISLNTYLVYFFMHSLLYLLIYFVMLIANFSFR